MKQLGFLTERRVRAGVVNDHPDLTRSAKPDALEAYLAHTVAIRAKPDRLRRLAGDRFGHVRMPSIICGTSEDGINQPLEMIMGTKVAAISHE